MTPDDDPSDAPVAYVPSSALPDPPVLTDLGTFVVDGETFSVRTSDDGAIHYDWVSGPNRGYGFSTSGGGAPRSRDRHEAAIRGFLASIDPATGYL